MNNAFTEFAARFDPAELEEGFNLTLNSNFITKMFNKKKYWPLYCELYPIMTEKGGGRYPQIYADEFVKEYERQIAEYRRPGGGDEHLKETVVMDDPNNMLPDGLNLDPLQMGDELSLEEDLFGESED
jgi:hypothetical protein